MLKPTQIRGREIDTTFVFIEILHSFESLDEETLKNKCLLDPVCRDNPPPRGDFSKEINLPFWNGSTRHRSLDS